MNIYQEVYDAVQKYTIEFNAHHTPLNSIEEKLEAQWKYVAQKLIDNHSQQVVKVAANKYPILQQIFQNNESEVRS